MPSEMAPVVRALSLTADGTETPKLWRGRVGAVEVVATRTGIGTRRARDATTRLLDTVPVEHVLVVGIAGGMGPSRVGDVLIPATVVDKETGAEYHPSPLGGAEPRGRLVTHDDFDMGDDEHARLVAHGFVAVDMETAAVAAVCAERGRPWLAVRAISDLVGVTPGDVIGLAKADGSPDLGASARYLLTKPWRIPKLVRLGRDSVRAARAAARTAADLLARA
jgi:adenosylhomocysteine nucleosidase